ncbi:MAG TPA: hypothetical protein VFY06_11175 [Verrucomicrobiae bacterium]|nr:hypothetical protein [Verrucomicrobiae bacterium]
MNTRSRLIEIEKLISKAHGLLTMVVESQPKPAPGKPPQPHYTRKIETQIWRAWDKLKSAGNFTASEAKRLVTGDKDPRHWRTDSFYSSILSRWASEGYIERVQEGRGTKAATYKISN